MVLFKLILSLGLIGAMTVDAIPTPGNTPHPDELPGCGEVNVILTYVVHISLQNDCYVENSNANANVPVAYLHTTHLSFNKATIRMVQRLPFAIVPRWRSRLDIMFDVS
jgi:hypothetical protein